MSRGRRDREPGADQPQQALEIADVLAMLEGEHRGGRQQPGLFEGRERGSALDGSTSTRSPTRTTGVRRSPPVIRVTSCERVEVIIDVDGMEGNAEAAQAPQGASRVDAPGGPQDLDGR